VSVRNERVEQHRTVRATSEQVWALVSDPGWFIRSHPGAPAVEKINDRLTMVHDDECGIRVIRTVDRIRPLYVAFRWEALGGAFHVPTLVQFWIDDLGDGTIRLRVCESGFAADPVLGEEHDRTLDDNDQGWAEALESVRTYFE